MPGLVPGIHDFYLFGKTWMAGTSPAMTDEKGLGARHGLGSGTTGSQS
jgi:hypothetical protein